MPAITWSVLAALWSASPLAAVALVLAATAFYVWTSPALALGMLGVTGVMLATMPLVGVNLFAVAAGVFVAAWIGQFVGHHVEGRRPSFLEDVQFLLVGPAWLLAAVYRRLGIAY